MIRFAFIKLLCIFSVQSFSQAIEFNGPEYIELFPKAKRVTKIYSDGFKIINDYNAEGLWISETGLIDQGQLAWNKYWTYDSQNNTADIYFIEGETNDTLIVGRKTFDDQGRLISDIGYSDVYSDSTFSYAYKNDRLFEKEIVSNEIFELWKYLYFEDRLSRIDIYNIESDSIVLYKSKFYEYSEDGYVIITKNKIVPQDSSRVYFYSNIHSHKDVTQKDNFFQYFQWPDTNIFSLAQKIDTIQIEDTLKLHAIFPGSEGEFEVIRDENGVINYFAHYFPNTNYGNVTFSNYSELDLRSDEGSFRLNAKGDTIWVGSNQILFDRSGRLKKRFVYKGKKDSKNLLREETYTYSDSSVVLISKYDIDGIAYRMTTERPSHQSIYKYHEKKEKWDAVQEKWVIYFEERRIYNKFWSELLYQDLNQEIYRTFNQKGVCIAEQRINLVSSIPSSWEIQVDYFD